MEGAIPSTKHEKRLTSEKNHEDSSKFYYHFLYKAVIVAIFLVILPIFPSQAPEFINQSLLTRSWELLHLVFVGIAISYGIFSRRNDETEKENGSKFDNAHSYVSRFLQVSSFFEEDPESPSGSDENKVQTWNSQYYRNEPVVVVAQQQSNLDEQSATSSRRIGGKPLLLPVRSLKSRVSDSSLVQSVIVNETISSIALNRSSSQSGSKSFSSSKAKNGGFEGLASPESEDSIKESLVLPSPIPWRSRSGRMEMKQEADAPAQYASSSPTKESEFSSRSLKSQTSRSSRANSMLSSPKVNPSSTSSPKELSPSLSFSLESQAKHAEDFVRKKSFHKSSPPPPPPPPLPPVFQKSISMKPRSNPFNEQASFDKELKRSFTSESKDSKWINTDSGIQVKASGHAEKISLGKSVRTARAAQNMAAGTRGRETGEDGMMNTMEAEEDFMEERARMAAGNDRMPFWSDKFMGHRSVSDDFAEEEKESFLDKDIVETDEDTETEDDDAGATSFIQNESGEILANQECPKADTAPSNNVIDEGPDVDKKADEFIAKFREQIRLQRIESIKRSARCRTSSR